MVWSLTCRLACTHRDELSNRSWQHYHVFMRLQYLTIKPEHYHAHCLVLQYHVILHFSSTRYSSVLVWLDNKLRLVAARARCTLLKIKCTNFLSDCNWTFKHIFSVKFTFFNRNELYFCRRTFPVDAHKLNFVFAPGLPTWISYDDRRVV